MLSTVFNPSSDVLSGFLSDWNERGWIVKHQGNLKSDYQIILLFTYFLRVVQGGGGLWHDSWTRKITNHGSRILKFHFPESWK